MLDAEVECRCVWLMFSTASFMEVGFCAKEIPSLCLFLSLLAYFFIIVLSIPLGFELAFLVLHVTRMQQELHDDSDREING